MSNAFYEKGREKFLRGELAWQTDTIKVMCVDSGTYTVNLATHEFASDVTGIVATSSALGTKTTTAGVADAADVLITGVTGNSFEALIFYKDTGSSATSPLIAYVDTGVIGLPAYPNGGDIAFIWNASGIFKL